MGNKESFTEKISLCIATAFFISSKIFYLWSAFCQHWQRIAANCNTGSFSISSWLHASWARRHWRHPRRCLHFWIM